MEQFYAVYIKGRDSPIGTARDSTLSALVEIGSALGREYTAKPVTKDEADRIKEELTRLPPETEALFSK